MHELRGVGQPTSGDRTHYLEHFRSPDLSIGTYTIPAGGHDDQTPHTEDELYLITHGRARLVTPSNSLHVGPGSVVFVPAHERHQFVDVTEQLAVTVIFGPAEETRSDPSLVTPSQLE